MNTGIKRSLLIVISFLGFVVALIFLDEASWEGDSSKPIVAPSLPIVSYLSVAASNEMISIPAFGELKPKWEVEIKSQVNGEVLRIQNAVEAGARIEHADVMVEIDSARYQTELDRAMLDLEQAKLELLQAEQKTELALSDWERSGLTSQPSDLTLFKPQLAIAKQNLVRAKSQLKLANKALSDTSVKAPFSGLIVERLVTRGQIVLEGESLFRLVDDQTLSLEIAVGEQQWQDLSSSWKGQVVDLFSANNKVVGQAKVERGGDILDIDTRQYKLHLEVPNQLRGQARAGQFVRMNLPGRVLSNVLRLPESALSQDGTIWLIMHDNTLREYTPEYYYRSDNLVLAAPPSSSMKENQAHLENSLWRVALRPLSYFLSGKKVSPQSHQQKT